MNFSRSFVEESRSTSITLFSVLLLVLDETDCMYICCMISSGRLLSVLAASLYLYGYLSLMVLRNSSTIVLTGGITAGPTDVVFFTSWERRFLSVSILVILAALFISLNPWGLRTDSVPSFDVRMPYIICKTILFLAFLPFCFGVLEKSYSIFMITGLSRR